MECREQRHCTTVHCHTVATKATSMVALLAVHYQDSSERTTIMSISADKANAKMEKGEMISSQEAKMRVWLGCALMASFVAVNCYRPLPDDQQTALGSSLAASGVLLYQMGRDSQ